MKILEYFKGNHFRVFALLSFAICCFYAIIFEPITWQAQGDSPAYIELAKQILGISTDGIDQSHRQPLYSLLIIPFMVLFGESYFIYPLMWFQFFLVFCSSLIIYKIFDKLRLYKNLPFIAGLLYLINLSTIHYGFNILTETLALFIFVSIAYLLVLYAKTGSYKILIFLGILNGLMVLARFNAMGLPAFTLLGLLLIHYHKYQFKHLRDILSKVVIYGLAVFFMLNIWMSYNYINKGFYGLIQKDHPRFSLVVYSRINPDIVVSTDNNEILNIFLQKRNEIINEKDKRELTYKQGSLLNYTFFNEIYFFFKGKEDHVGGWELYKKALPDLLDYYGLDANDPEALTKLSILLSSFNQDIRNQTKKDELRQRFSALLQTFRHSGSTLPVNEPVNLNVLPSFIFLIYRLTFMGIMFFTAIVSVIILLRKVWTIPQYDNYLLLVLILLILYFPVSHFMAITPGDANRFKFPSEPLIIGLFVFYIQKGFGWFKNKYFKNLQ